MRAHVVREVLFPLVLSRIEQPGHFASVGIDPGKIGAFVLIAFWTRESEVFQVVGAAMLAGEDVVDVESESRMSLR